MRQKRNMSEIRANVSWPLSLRVLRATEDGKAYFSPRHVCDALGIDWNGQRVKIKADPVLSSVVEIISTTGRDGKTYKMSMLPIEFANGWLFT